MDELSRAELHDVVRIQYKWYSVAIVKQGEKKAKNSFCFGANQYNSILMKRAPVWENEWDGGIDVYSEKFMINIFVEKQLGPKIIWTNMFNDLSYIFCECA